jgi:hypothetical protein
MGRAPPGPARRKKMIRKSMLAVCAAALAFAALPALASAVEISDPEAHFTVDGATALLETASGTEVHCKTVEGVEGVTGTGQFSGNKKGSVKFTFHNCRGPLNITCNSSEQPSGTIETTTLPFTLETVNGNPAVLIKPNEGHFVSFHCSAFAGIEVTGNGIIGTITSPGIGEASTEATVSFEQSEGTQAHRFVDGDETEYDLESSLNGGPLETAGEQATGTLTFEEAVELLE